MESTGQNLDSANSFTESAQFEHQNFCSRTRLSRKLWLDCLLALVKCLIGQVKGVGQIPGKWISYENCCILCMIACFFCIQGHFSSGAVRQTPPQLDIADFSRFSWTFCRILAKFSVCCFFIFSFWKFIKLFFIWQAERLKGCKHIYLKVNPRFLFPP